MKLAIPALLLAALTLQATPVPFLEGVGITYLSFSVDTTGAHTTGIGGNVDLTPGRFLHIPGYSSLYFVVGGSGAGLYLVNSTQPAPYTGAFDWTYDGPAVGVQPFMLQYTMPAEAAGVPEPGSFWPFLGGSLAYISWKVTAWAIRRWRHWRVGQRLQDAEYERNIDELMKRLRESSERLEQVVLKAENGGRQ